MHWANHSSSSCVECSGRSSFIDLMCAPATFLSRKSVRVTSECTHVFFVMRGVCCVPPILEAMYLVSPRYMVSGMPSILL